MIDLTHRKEGIQRIQVGLAGLTGVVLLVGLANIVVDNVKRDDVVLEASGDTVENTTATGGNSALKPKEPLAELGVAPASDAAVQPPVVADLQPDPNLKQPMDRPAPVGPARPDAMTADEPQAQ